MSSKLSGQCVARNSSTMWALLHFAVHGGILSHVAGELVLPGRMGIFLSLLSDSALALPHLLGRHPETRAAPAARPTQVSILWFIAPRP